MTDITKTILSAPFESESVTFTTLTSATATEECSVDMTDCGDVLTLIVAVPAGTEAENTLTVSAGDYINGRSFEYTLEAGETACIPLESALVKQDTGKIVFTVETDNADGVTDESIKVAAVAKRYVTAH